MLTELTFNCVPEEGWKEGVDKLKLQLLSEGKVYASILGKGLQVTPEPSLAPLVLMLVGGTVAIIGACGLGYYVVKRR